jgi:hypothetical protein
VVTSSRNGPMTTPELPAVRLSGAVLEDDTWTGTDAFTRVEDPVRLRQPVHDHLCHDRAGQASDFKGATLDPSTGTLYGLDAAAHSEVLKIRLKAQREQHRHVMQGQVLLGVLFVIFLTLVLVVVGIGVKWITEGFGEHLISLVLTAAMSGLGGAVAWAFRESSTEQGRRSSDPSGPQVDQ